jgi:hypothetical protein
MKNTRERSTHKKFSRPQALGKISKSWSLQGLRRQPPSPSSMIPKYGMFRNQAINGAARSRLARSTISRALIAACSFLLLLFSCIGAVEGIANAQTNTPHLLSATTSAVRPTRTPPGRRSPTPTAHAPSPTLVATLTTIPSVTANETPSVKVATPQATQKHRSNQMPTPISTQPTPSTTSTVRQTSYFQQNDPPLSLVILGTLGGIGGVMLLLTIGLVLLRKYLMPSARMRLSPSGATPWQRMRINSLDGRESSSDQRLQTRPTLGGSSLTSSDIMPETDGYLPTTRNVIPSQSHFSSTTSNSPLKKKQLKLPTAHFLRPTKLKAMKNNGILDEPRNSDLNYFRQNSQLGTALREPWEEQESEEIPSLDDPSLQETLQYYILKGQLARQSNESEQQEHDKA